VEFINFSNVKLKRYQYMKHHKEYKKDSNKYRRIENVFVESKKRVLTILSV